ncbi:MAG TPA: methylated-DNA--[protein]-cysteine S-methyltransferase [Acidimicrobiales bacterium]|nr:methylated-DNA--[protein]-cysteine S-methyltransferase [Acidimicrobiales bacterium]
MPSARQPSASKAGAALEHDLGRPAPRRAPEPAGLALFDTPVGRCGVVWGDSGILAIQLPESRDTATRARLVQRFPGISEAAPPPEVRRALDAIVLLLRGEASDLSSVVLDMTGVPPFHRRVYEAARAIPPGTTLSYGELATKLGSPGAARAVGQALGRNPFAIVVPCHRVLAAGGRIGGFSANGGVVTKLRLLSIEGAGAGAAAAQFDGDGALGFDPEVATAHVRAADGEMARLIDAVGPLGLRVDQTPSIFGALAEAIVYQQLTGRAAATIFARVRALFPHSHHSPTPEQILRASEEKLRSAGLSRSKLLSLRDLARRTVDGELPTLAEVQRLEDEEVVEQLTGVRGIGRWTVEMLLIFRLGRPDVLPSDDYGVRKGFAAMMGSQDLPTRAALETHGDRWRPYRTVASWYLWRAAEGALSSETLLPPAT